MPDPLALIDDLLEILVVPSFTRAGFAIRRRLFAWTAAESSSMVGATPGLEASLPGFHDLVGGLLRTPAEGADTIVWLATSDEGRRMTGRVFLDRRPRPFDRVPATRLSAGARRTLWESVVEMTAEPDPAA